MDDAAAAQATEERAAERIQSRNKLRTTAVADQHGQVAGWQLRYNLCCCRGRSNSLLTRALTWCHYKALPQSCQPPMQRAILTTLCEPRRCLAILHPSRLQLPLQQNSPAFCGACSTAARGYMSA